MKDVKMNAIRMLVGFCIFFAGIAIIISAKINFKYGIDIDPLIGWVMATLGGIEIFLPLVSMFAVGFYKNMGHTWSFVLAIVSVITAISFVSSNRYQAEDDAKGYSSLLESNKQALSSAQTSYNQASDAASAAALQCTAEIKKGRNGYQTKACNAAEMASEAQQTALSALNSARLAVARDQKKVVSSGDGFFRDAAEMIGGKPESWRAVINLIMGVIIALTGFITLLVSVHVIKLHLIADQPKRPMASPAPNPAKLDKPKAVQPAPKPELKSVDTGPKG